ncbi:flavodoxin family protein [Dethiosulfatarculus sandiegensis]|uniref:FMN reductase n=1 Tax=Dethiosulfatarculus sandiegensis TaxID=1429043 RepID=A0A0D2JHT9_9BACT|nr:flavodoxin family protein [Dethiosulfatarculus sandiegensis]KIX15311.1 FMN reductase [Dethiosulfatarculus sandiegensis]
MRALAINGSPRKGGNTQILLEKALEPLNRAGWETELVQIGGKKIQGCLACRKCAENLDQKCAVKKDIFNEIMGKMISADALILGSPTYFTDVSAEMKALLDRSGLVALANGRLFKGKIGAAVAAQRRAGSIHVFDTINHMFLMNQMIIPGSIYWNMGLGREKGEVKEDAEGLANMENLGLTIDWLAKAIKPQMGAFPGAN